MEIKISLDELRQRKLFLACPMYGGACAGLFAKSMMDLATLCTQNGIELRTYFLFNESLVTRARAYCVDEFLRSGYTHMMFIDSDIGFDPKDVLALLALQSDESQYDVIAGAYPKKCIAWEKVKIAVDKGLADDDSSVLERYIGDYVFNPKSGVGQIRIDEPVEVSEAGTGFMMIRRNTFDRFKEAFPEYGYKPDHARTEHFDGSREIHMYFQAEIDPDSKRYLSEDYFFCYKIQKIGLKVWLAPWIKLQHVGSMIFGGSLIDLAQLGVSATVDTSLLKKRG